MPWVIDTCILLDVAENDPAYGQASCLAIDRCRSANGCSVCPVSLIELAPQFAGKFANLTLFLNGCGISFSDQWLMSDSQAAFEGWNRYVQAKRSGGNPPKRPIADILIGAFAQQRTGLLTRNPSDFTRWFPSLNIVRP